jgi:hypothetical protein
MRRDDADRDVRTRLNREALPAPPAAKTLPAPGSVRPRRRPTRYHDGLMAAGAAACVRTGAIGKEAAS